LDADDLLSALNLAVFDPELEFTLRLRGRLRKHVSHETEILRTNRPCKQERHSKQLKKAWKHPPG
jgi:hypothetical protein